MKIICVERVLVGLSCDTNFEWHMPICVERCGAEQKYMPIFGNLTERDFWKKTKAQEHIQMMQRIRVKLKNSDCFEEFWSVHSRSFGLFYDIVLLSVVDRTAIIVPSALILILILVKKTPNQLKTLK